MQLPSCPAEKRILGSKGCGSRTNTSSSWPCYYTAGIFRLSSSFEINKHIILNFRDKNKRTTDFISSTFAWTWNIPMCLNTPLGRLHNDVFWPVCAQNVFVSDTYHQNMNEVSSGGVPHLQRQIVGGRDHGAVMAIPRHHGDLQLGHLVFQWRRVVLPERVTLKLLNYSKHLCFFTLKISQYCNQGLRPIMCHTTEEDANLPLNLPIQHN